MNDSTQFEACIQEYRVNRRREMRGYIKRHYNEMQDAFCRIMDELIRKQIRLKQAGEDEEVTTLCFWHLLSSDHTGSYEMAVGMCGKKIQLDEHMAYVYWKPELLYDGIDQEMEALERFLRKCFPSVGSYDVIQLKYKLLMDDWLLFGKSVRKLAAAAEERIQKSPMQAEKEIQVMIGDYKGQMSRVCGIRPKKDGA